MHLIDQAFDEITVQAHPALYRFTLPKFDLWGARGG